ncbi:MAG: GAF domain-containing protein, partial [Anaerolineales bacterium]
QRRLGELDTIGHVSRAILTSLDLDSLLRTIYDQVSDLLDVENFYVALHDLDTGLLTYPLAIKHGQRQTWASRELTDRLTDRVIETAAPILIPQNASKALQAMGLPDLHNPPESWMGVPLLNPQRAIGCMAVFHLESGNYFSEKDLDILQTVAAQAAVALENALLYQQTRSRAQALASLNEITALLSSTLDPDRALELVGMSMIRVGGGQKSAIYLLDHEKMNLELAYSANLSDEFIARWHTLSLEDQDRALCIHSGAPILIPNLTVSQLPEPIAQDLSLEGIEAFADFPLTTPEGTIGQISVYFDKAQRFKPDQIELLRTFAAQAALAVANARAHAATDKALQRRVEQLATLEAIGREMVATLDTQPLFQTILEAALELTQAQSSRLAIYVMEQGGLRIVADQGYVASSPAANHEAILPLDQGIEGQTFNRGELQNYGDISQIFDRRSWTGSTRGSLLSAPIINQGQVLGVITLEHPQTDHFSKEHESILLQLAAQAAVALSNAMLYQQLEARLTEQSLLYQASAQIASTLEGEAVASAVADSLAVAIHADIANIFRWNPDREVLEGLATVKHGRPEHDIESMMLEADQVPSLQDCLLQRIPCQWTVSSAPTDADRKYLEDSRGARSILAVPLVLGRKALGLMEAFSLVEREFDQNAIRTAQTIASQAAIALENTDLFMRINESRNRLLAVLNSTHEGMLFVDTGGQIVMANEKVNQLLGFMVEDLVGKRIASTETDIAARMGYRQGEIANLLAALRGGQAVFSQEQVYTLEEPARRTLQRSEAPVHDAEDQLIGWLIVLRDISEEKELEKAQEQLTEMIVHDLRSPLTAILGSINLLEKSQTDLPQNAVVNQALSVSRRSVQQLLSLVNSLLDIAKLESGELKLVLESVDLAVMCDDLLKTFQPEANQEGVILAVDIDANTPDIQADKEKLQRVLVNLIDNALKFTPEGGSVEIRTRADSNENVVIEIADSGPGIPEEFRERIFDRFSQVPGRTGRRRGTGLGLSFAKLAVDAHGGKIWIEDNDGGGSVFAITLPIKTETAN